MQPYVIRQGDYLLKLAYEQRHVDRGSAWQF
jgi:hypothetical protein